MSTEQAVLIASTVDRVSPDVTADRIDRLQVELVGYAQQLSFTQLPIVRATLTRSSTPTPPTPPWNSN